MFKFMLGVTVWAIPLLLGCGVSEVIAREDLRFSLGGTVYFNNSVITITDVGTEGSTTPLECITDLRPCCRQSDILGEWHYPNGSRVEGNGPTEGKYFFFRIRGLNDGRVNLFRRNSGVVSPYGSYCCEIPDTTGVNRTLCANLAPSGFSFVINDGGVVPTTGQSYSLTCSVSGGSVSSYQWWKDGAVLQGQTTEMLSFSPLRLSDAGRYTCQVTVTASSETFTAYQNHSVIILTPAPTSVSVTSDQPNPIRPFGSTVTLTCTVVLAEYVEGLTVNTEWTGPNGFSQNEMAQRMGSTTTYTSTAMVSSFGRDQSGVYNCTATVNSTSSFITNSASLSATSRIFVSATIVLTSDPFQLTSEIDSVEVTFSLTCNSTGGPVSSVIWTRDGLLLDNTGPLVLTDASTASYTNVLQVNGRTPGTYTCQIRGDDNQILSSMDYNVHAAAPPLNVQATQSSASAPVEVSWSPPSSGATNITGYRVFYNGQVGVFLPATINGVLIERDNLGQEISIRSESSTPSRLPSELISATLTISIPESRDEDKSINVTTIALGAVIVLVVVIATVVVVILISLLLTQRRRSTTKELDKFNDLKDISASTNVAYGQFNQIESSTNQNVVYEELDKMASSVPVGGEGQVTSTSQQPQHAQTDEGHYYI